ncbi:MAG TPA: tetratricopeptide repeat protein [Myxococcales bacterium]
MRRCAPIAAIFMAASAAMADRLPMQIDFDHCAIAMVNSGAAADMQGQLRMELLIRRDGRVYAAFVSAERGLQNRKMERCLTNAALLWVFPPPAIDYQRSYGPVSILPAYTEADGVTTAVGLHAGQAVPNVMLPKLDEIPPAEPLRVEVARATLDVDEQHATTAQYGLGHLAVRSYPEAIKLFRDALSRNADDAEALRGLAEALAESKGDLKEARQAAARLLQIAPDSVAGHEAMIKVCLAANDGKCAAEHWKPANKAADFGPRSRLFAEQLYPAVKQAAEDLRTHAATQQQQQSAPEDPCAGVQGEDQQTLCVAKRCLDAGSAEYAKELSGQNKVEYVAGEWRVKKVGQGKMLVTREIATRETPPQQHNAMWLVKVGDQLIMQPTNAEARQITLTHNACAARVTAGK